MATPLRKAQQTELYRLLKEVSAKMGDFEGAVERLRELKDSLAEADEALAQRAKAQQARLAELDAKFEQNRLKAVRDAAAELGKLLVDREEHEELREQAKRRRDDREERLRAEEASFQERFAREARVIQLQHTAEAAEAKAALESRDLHIQNLQEALRRMDAELTSQKDLTASVVAGPRAERAPAPPGRA